MTRSVIQLGGKALKLDADGDTTIQVSSDDVLIVDTAGNEALKIDANGHVTKPLQPAFSVNKSSDQNNIGLNTTVDITFDTEVFDNNSDFASNQFTAPVTGKYNLHFLFRLDAIDTGAVYYQTTITTSNRNYTLTLDPNYSSDVDYEAFSLSVLADMDANDTASCIIYQAGGSQQTDIKDGTTFMGHLVC